MKSDSLETSRAQQLAKALRQGIQRGQWPVGGVLPTTRELAQQYSVGLATVREVMQDLETQGLIERRPRRGTLVKARTPQAPGGKLELQQVAVVGVDARHDLDSWSYRVGHAVEQTLWGQGFEPVPLRYSSTRPDAAEELLSRIEAMEAGLIGAIVFNHPQMRLLPAMLDEIGMPWVTINRMTADQAHNFIAADNIIGCRLVGECIARLGHHRVLVLIGNSVSVSETESEKVTGLIQGFLHAEAPITGVHYDQCRNEDVSFELTRRHIQRHGPPEAVFVLGDQMASGVIAACVEAGLRVPEDVKIVGGAGLELARHTRPRLSVITQPMEAIGQQACQMIQEMIRRNIRRIEPRRVRGRFIVRESLPVPEPLLRRLEQRYPEMIERDPAAAEKP